MHFIAITPPARLVHVRWRMSRISTIRWVAGALACVLWAGLVLSGREERLWFVVAALVAVEIFGACSAAMVMWRGNTAPVVTAATDWGGVAAATAIWTLGVGAAALFGANGRHIAVLFLSLCLALAWLVAVFIVLNPQRTGDENIDE